MNKFQILSNLNDQISNKQLVIDEALDSYLLDIELVNSLVALIEQGVREWSIERNKWIELLSKVVEISKITKENLRITLDFEEKRNAFLEKNMKKIAREWL